MRRIALACFILFAAPLLAQMPVQTGVPAPVWFSVTPESATVSVTLPAGATYRFGDSVNNLWSAAVTVGQPTTIDPVSMAGANPFPFADPDPGTAKELDVLETAAAQAIPIEAIGASGVASVYGVVYVPSLTPPTTIPVPPGQVYAVTLSNIHVVPTNELSPTTDWLGLYDLPASGANVGFEGNQFNLTIDGVTLVCSYSGGVNGTFSLSCAVPAAN
jgi:hypothetical protein